MNKTIAIIGVDGSGKSTLIEKLQEKFGEKVEIKYMGSVRYEDKRIEELMKKETQTYLDVIKIQYLTYKCFWYRYKTALRTKKLVLFDRYVNERYLNSTGKYKVIATVLYKYLFPSPSFFIYLHCSVDTSFKRKNDIPNKEAFIAMKRRFDNCYLSKKDCLCINSDTYNADELTDMVCSKILKYYNGKI